MAFDYLSSTLKVALTGQAQKNVTGANPIKKDCNFTINSPASTAGAAGGAANAAAGGADVLVAKVYSIAGSGTLNIDMSSLTDFLSQSAIAIVRVKEVFFCLLGTGDTLADGSTGTACSSVTIGNGTNGNTLFFDNISYTLTLFNTDLIAWAKRGAAGKTVDGSHKVIKVVNNDAGVAAALLVGIVGGSS